MNIIAQSGAPVSCGVDTTEDVLATITIPGGTLGANDSARLTMAWGRTGHGGSTDTLRIYFGGTLVQSKVLNFDVTVEQSNNELKFCNKNSTNAQIVYGTGAQNSFVNTALDMTQDQDIVIKGQNGNSADATTLLQYTLEALV